MRHADDELLHAGFAGALNEIVEHRDQRLAAFEREALLADEARIQIALDALGARQAVENRRLLFARERPVHAARFELLAQPQPLARARHVRELGGELAAIDLLQQRQDVLELHARVAGAGQPAQVRPVENSREVRLVEPKIEADTAAGRSHSPSGSRSAI